ncbi:MAG: SDR family NAD(P)-dependent oxidoreductase [Bacteroidetes bacterium]|nr:SDR family NAD(P)-dependent oxidoreductase [Bacteroidota bacterium]
MKRDWNLADMPTLDGKIALVTGANAGIGYITASELARRGARVLLGVRDTGRGDAAKQRLLAEVPGADLRVLQLDLSDLRSIEGAVMEIQRTYDHLDLLVNNAGVMIPPLTRTAQGFELQIGVNHFGHFALTMQLLGLLDAADSARVVTVSSGAHKIGRPDFEDINWERRKYRALQAYADSKFANLLFTFELQRRLAAEGSTTIAVAAHPGVAMTELQRHSRWLAASSRLISHSVEEAALPTLRAATDPDVRGAEYFGPGKMFELKGAPARVQPIRRAEDSDLARRLWTLSERLTGTTLERPSGRNAA